MNISKNVMKMEAGKTRQFLHHKLNKTGHLDMLIVKKKQIQTFCLVFI